jgi:hypothetical protein
MTIFTRTSIEGYRDQVIAIVNGFALFGPNVMILTGVILVEDPDIKLVLSQHFDLCILGQGTGSYSPPDEHVPVRMPSCPLHPQSHPHLQADSKEGRPSVPVVKH